MNDRLIIWLGTVGTALLFAAHLAAKTAAFLTQGLAAAAVVCFLSLALSLGLAIGVGIYKRCKEVRKWEWATLALSLVALCIYRGNGLLNPSDDWLVGSDQGLYLAQSQLIQKTGKTVWYPEPREALADLRDIVFTEAMPGSQRDTLTEYRRPRFIPHYFGVDLKAPEAGLTAMFPDGFPFYLAGWGFWFGESAKIWANPCWLVISSLLVTVILLRYTSLFPALLTGLLFGSFPLNIWAGNHLYSEPMAGTIWLLAIYCAMVRSRAGMVGFALCANFLPLIKIDGLWAVGGGFVAIHYLFRKTENKQSTWWSLVLYGGLTITTVFLLWSDKYTYYYATLGSIAQSIVKSTYTPLIVCLFIVLYKCKNGIFKWDKWAICMAFVGILYLWLLRPYVGLDSDRFYYDSVHKIIESEREYTLWRLGWYFSQPALILSLAGCIFLLARDRDLLLKGMVWAGLIVLLFFVYDLRNRPEQPYAFRRFSIYAIPVLFVGMAWAVEHLRGLNTHFVRPFILLGVIALSLHFASMNREINSFKEGGEGDGLVAAIASKLISGDILIVRGESTLRGMAPTLAFTSGVNLLPIYYKNTSKKEINKRLNPWLRRWENACKPVYMLTTSRNETNGLSHIKSELAGNWEGDFIYRSNYDPIKGNTFKKLHLNIYLLRLRLTNQ